MAEPFSRLTPLIGTDAYLRLKNASVAVFGLGGVGGFVVEALARSGIGKLTLIDGDRFEESNINRQIGALYSTLKEPKSEVMLRRVKDINPEAVVKSIPLFYTGGEEIFTGGFGGKTRNTHSQRNGRRQQNRSVALQDSGYLFHKGMSSCQSHARAPESCGRKITGRRVQRRAGREPWRTLQFFTRNRLYGVADGEQDHP